MDARQGAHVHKVLLLAVGLDQGQALQDLCCEADKAASGVEAHLLDLGGRGQVDAQMTAVRMRTNPKRSKLRSDGTDSDREQDDSIDPQYGCQADASVRQRYRADNRSVRQRCQADSRGVRQIAGVLDRANLGRVRCAQEGTEYL
jgi:hypothetical protein